MTDFQRRILHREGRSALIGGLGIIAAVSIGITLLGWPWWQGLAVLVFPAAFAADWLLMRRRMLHGVYGNNRMEAMEAVEAFMASKRQ